MELLGFIAGMDWLSILCLVLGLGMVIFEMFHPGFGAPGIIGGILIFLGILLSAKTIIQALVMIIIIIAILALALTLVLHSASKGHLSRNLVLSESLDKPSNRAGMEDLQFFIDREGTTLTVLRPSGTADFDGVRLDVVSEGEFIPKGAAVKITKIEGHRIVVKPTNI